MKRLIRITVPYDEKALEDVSSWLERSIQFWRHTPNTERQILRAIVTGLRGVEPEVEQEPDREERIADTFAAAVAAGKEVLDSLVAALRANKETLEDLDARLDPAAAEERLRGFAEALRPSKPQCSTLYATAEPSRCSNEVKYSVTVWDCGKTAVQHSCWCHLRQTISRMTRDGNACHVKAV